MAGTAVTTPSRSNQAERLWKSISSAIARFDPAAVRSRIQSPRRISQVMMPPVTCSPWTSEAAIASVSRKSTFSRRSRRQTPQARRAIGTAFHSISGTLSASASGVAVNARASETVGSASTEGPSFGGGLAGVAAEPWAVTGSLAGGRAGCWTCVAVGSAASASATRSRGER